MMYEPQPPLEVAAIRAYLAPAGTRRRVLGSIRRIFDGAHLLDPPAGLWHVWAFGTFRQTDCYRAILWRCDADYTSTIPSSIASGSGWKYSGVGNQLSVTRSSPAAPITWLYGSV